MTSPQDPEVARIKAEILMGLQAMDVEEAAARDAELARINAEMRAIEGEVSDTSIHRRVRRAELNAKIRALGGEPL
ncbi:MAG TPA: hypothetical protein VKG61_25260 [Streptosporangiaceae bacterium]|nr:hypothetical protein [Streptosporangiaceae bacterium]